MAPGVLVARGGYPAKARRWADYSAVPSICSFPPRQVTPVADSYDVFVSYAREDRRLAQSWRELLVKRGLRVFLDLDNPPGGAWRKSLEQALRQSTVVCVLWSEASHRPDRPFVREEAERARRSGAYFPICLDDSGVPFGFGETQYADLIGWSGDTADIRLSETVAQLEAFLGERRVRTDPDPQPPQGRLIDTRRHPLSSGMAPEWASAWGEDPHGVWVQIRIGDVEQRLRWIAPGSFTMGSPEDEPGRFDDEGPAHEVLLTLGYWLFDTPCTQALWQAVMDENPSNFQSPDRPVEMVGWDDCQDFLKRINQRLPGLELTLPSEAQWEHACRAGAESALYTGAMEILGDANAPALDPIAWYGGNSGVGFDLKGGVHIKHLENRQYDSNPSGTHPVALKKANAWGLYDMLGNVWEWCLDGQRDYAEGTQIDPQGTTAAGAVRVVRGGSWSALARFCRCACRFQDDPGFRGDFLGFRPARVQV